jgi:hypothetical protein
MPSRPNLLSKTVQDRAAAAHDISVIRPPP